MAYHSSVSPTGEQIAAAAYALTPLKPHGLSLTIVVISIILAILTTFVAGLRILVRLGLLWKGITKIWKMEDYLFVSALALFIPSIVWGIIAAHYGVGIRDVDLPSPLYVVRAGEYIIYWELLYFISSTLIKSAIGFTCIRIDQRRRVAYPVLLNMSVMALTAVLALAFVFANCTPLAATWNPRLGHCQTVISLETVSYLVSVVQAMTDWISALYPCYIVSKLQMPRRTKITIVFVLGLGILASIATIVRLPYLRYYDTAKYKTDFLFHVGVIVVCSNVECSLGIIACSLPPLRKIVKMYYQHWSSYKLNPRGEQQHDSGTKLGPLRPQSDGFYSTRVHSEHGMNGMWKPSEINDDSSRKGILE